MPPLLPTTAGSPLRSPIVAAYSTAHSGPSPWGPEAPVSSDIFAITAQTGISVHVEEDKSATKSVQASPANNFGGNPLLRGNPD